MIQICPSGSGLRFVRGRQAQGSGGKEDDQQAGGQGPAAQNEQQGAHPQVGRQVQAAGSAACGSASLRLLRNNQPQRCPACGAQQPPGSRFCNQCGAPLA